MPGSSARSEAPDAAYCPPPASASSGAASRYSGRAVTSVNPTPRRTARAAVRSRRMSVAAAAEVWTSTGVSAPGTSHSISPTYTASE